MIGEGVLIEKFHIIDGVFILFAISGSKGIQEVKFRKSGWIEK